MATKLKKLRVHEVSLVNRPANPGADILLVKADDGKGEWKPCEDCPSPKTCKANGGCAAEDDTEKMGAAGCMPKKTKRKKGEREMLKAAFDAVADARETLIGKSETEEAEPVLALAACLVEQDYAKAATMFDELVGAENEREMLWRATRALNDSIHSIMANGGTAKPKLLRKTLYQFVAYLEGEFDLDEDAEGEPAEKGDDEDAASGGDRAGGSGPSEEDEMSTTTKQAPGADAEAIAKANSERDEAVKKAAALENDLKKAAERLEALEKAQQEQAIDKKADDLAAIAPAGIEKAKLRELVAALPDAGLDTLKGILAGVAKQASTAGLFQTFGKADAEAAAEAGPAALKKAAEARAEEMRKSAARRA